MPFHTLWSRLRGRSGPANPIEYASPFPDVFDSELMDIEISRMARGQLDRPVASGYDPETRGAQSNLVGLAFSGGGIRSATFNLGVLQGLAELDLLRRVDYLSTVSGGGYIGSWLGAWLARQNFEDVCKQLRPEWKDQAGPSQPKPRREPPQINFLREYSNYLTPRLGMLGTDTWAAVATILRNLLLNLSILILTLTAILLVPRVATLLSCWLQNHPKLTPAAALALLVAAVALVGYDLRSFSVKSQKPPRVTGQFWISILILPAVFLGAWTLSVWLWHLAIHASALPTFPWMGDYFLHHEWAPWAVWGGAVYFSFWVMGWLVGPVFDFFRADEGKKTEDLNPQNWFLTIVVAPFAGAVGGLLVWCVSKLFESWVNSGMAWWNVTGLGTAITIFVFILAVVVHIGFMGRRFPDEKREWFSRLGGLLMVVALGWAALFGFAIYGPLPLISSLPAWLKSTGLITWLGSTAAGVLGGKSSSSGGESTSTKPTKNLSLSIITTAAPYVFVVGLLLLLSLGLYKVQSHYQSPTDATTEKTSCIGLVLAETDSTDSSSTCLPLATARTTIPAPVSDQYWSVLNKGLRSHLAIWLCLACLVAAGLLSWRVDINEFSMHMLYRNRLARSYLGASNCGRKPQPFTGFDPNDDILLRDLISTNPASNAFAFTVSSPPAAPGSVEIPPRTAAIPGGSAATTEVTSNKVKGAPVTPEITGASADPMKGSDVHYRLRIFGKGFARRSTVVLRCPIYTLLVPPKEITRISPNEIRLNAKLNSLTMAWTIQITNHKAPDSNVFPFVAVAFEDPPFVTSVTFSSVSDSRNNRTFSISGSGFTMEPKVILRSEKETIEIPRSSTKFIDSTSIEITTNISVPSERWSAQVINSRRIDGKNHYQGPYPIINATLNIVKGEELAWQERKGASFIFTPRFSGFNVDRGSEDCHKKNPPGKLGQNAYRPTESYAYRNGGPFLGTAMAISGAAASPNMGYHSSPSLAFLMTVFNVRLGWWFGNPRHTKKFYWQTPGPRIGLSYLLVELLGAANDSRAYVYISDGGHFENLALYELVRRRCRFIIVSDAGADGAMKFGDLGNAIEKCRVDFGVDIEIDMENLRCDPATKRSEWHCAVGKIRYDHVDPDVPPGTLLYLKPSLTGDEPADILRYRAQCPVFPHQSTADQWFDESQFESYRALGQHILEKTFLPVAGKDALKTLDLETLLVELRKHWHPPSKFVQKSFTKHTATYTALLERMRTEDKLKFLDAQVYAEWPDLTAAVAKEHALTNPGLLPLPTANFPSRSWLPDNEDELRAGFYFCSEVIQLFEDAYVDLNIEEEHSHPDNRGWMNLFLHWAWSGMFRATWAVSAGIYGSRFQKFCERYLDLTLGTVEIGKPTPLPEDPTERKTSLGEMAVKGDILSPWEVALVQTFLDYGRPKSERPLSNLSAIPLRMKVTSPRDKDKSFEFPIGCAIVQIKLNVGGKASACIVYFRIRNHIRKLGLARVALKKLSETYTLSALNRIRADELTDLLAEQKTYLDPMRKDAVEKVESIREALPSEETWTLFRLKVVAITNVRAELLPNVSSREV